MVIRDEAGPFSVLLARPDGAPSAPGVTTLIDADASSNAADQLLRIAQVTDAEFFAGDLFRRRFNCDPPNFPAHFVALYRAATNCYVTVGYVHYSIFDELCLCGGMTDDDRAVRRMPGVHQAAIRTSGGVCATLLRESLALLPDIPAVWACVGEAPVREELRRAGFAPVDDPYLMVRWHRELTPDDQQSLLARVQALGLF